MNPQDLFFRYCCRDSAVTFEISNKLSSALSPKQEAHYRFNNTVLNSLLYMELRGIRYDEKEAKRRLAVMQGHVYRVQALLDNEAKMLGAIKGIDFSVSHAEILLQVQAICGMKKDPTKPKKSYVDDGYWDTIKPLQQDSPLTSEQQGAISVLCKATMNTKSSKFKDFLYNPKYLALPIQWKKDPATKEKRIASDYETLLRLSKQYDKPALKFALDLSLFRTRCQMLEMVSYKGRIFTAYNLVGSETGRVTSSKSMIYA